MPWTPPPKPRKSRIHPIWGGIGCFMIPLYFAGSYYAAEFLVRQNRVQHWLYIPPDITALQQTVGIAALIFALSFAVIAIVWGFIRGPLHKAPDVGYSKMRHIKRRF